ncbi:hypothetical protein DERF_008955 [Dermatophagoides farinae]|uniref:Uncharacterized protein n=1 Tax=Dermatophagoides farinae TaxID=6954 RepID=A0A922HY38_DERFA|nr:hypothetical protein DERF_008955 [Dermatophagoides farinae]
MFQKIRIKKSTTIHLGIFQVSMNNLDVLSKNKISSITIMSNLISFSTVITLTFKTIETKGQNICFDDDYK